MRYDWRSPSCEPRNLRNHLARRHRTLAAIERAGIDRVDFAVLAVGLLQRVRFSGFCIGREQQQAA